MNPSFLTAVELAEAAAYHRPKYLYALVSEVTDLLLIALILGLLVRPLYAGSMRLAGWLDHRLGALRQRPVFRGLLQTLDRLWKGPGWGTALLFAVATYFTLVLANLPAALYFEWHERRFQLSTYGHAAFAWDWFKGLAATTFLRGTLAFGMYGLARRLPHWWVPLGLCCGALMLISSALDPYRARLFFDQQPLEPGPLRTQLESVLSLAQVEYSDIRVEKTSRVSRRAGAYFAGQGPTRTILLNDVIVAQFSPQELSAVVAHEAAHIGESRWLNRVAAALALPAFLGLLAWMFRVAARRRWWGVSDPADIRTLPLATISIYLLLSLSAPLTGYLSRERERAADARAIELTGDPDAFRSMLVKLCRINKCDPQPPRWLVLRSATHPPLAERVQFAERWRPEAEKKNQVSTGGPP
ncbi:MAG: M48 family metalloprotease [Myxococcota bacterium]|nr:M48 family metalloprotease [Myxococcota bacterium]